MKAISAPSYPENALSHIELLLIKTNPYFCFSSS